MARYFIGLVVRGDDPTQAWEQLTANLPDEVLFASSPLDVPVVDEDAEPEYGIESVVLFDGARGGSPVVMLAPSEELR